MSETNCVNSPEKKFHLFRSLSELKQESKGGYIDTEFIVPHGTKTIELELMTKEKTAHPHLLFITPFKKSREEKGHKKNKNEKQNMTAKDYKVVLKQDESGKYQVEKPGYVPGKIIDLVGPHFWIAEDRTIKLGSDGLKLTVVKCGQREKIEFLNEVKEERNVQENYEEGKVMLQVTFDGSDPIWPIFLVDKKKYSLQQIHLCTTSRICNSGDHVIFLKFEGVSITEDIVKLLELFLYHEVTPGTFCEMAKSSNVHKSGELIAFKINASNLKNIEIVYFRSKLNDPDVPDIINIDTSKNFIKVKEHNPAPGGDCLCEDSVKHLDLFKKSKKRNNLESSSNLAKKFCQDSPITSTNSPTTSSSSANESPVYGVDGNFSPNGIIDTGVPENPGQIDVPENLDEENSEMLINPGVIPVLELNDLAGWENLLGTDGQISKKREKIIPKCQNWYCRAQPTLSDYVTKLGYVFDKKFLCFALVCIIGNVIMNI